ncbi:NAD(P)/FAD-dependent oxidoreductase [Psychrobacter sp. PAMC 21119]|uniref:NAD(P)/FAD-dependent oxidoreductase n=1 Tax=Psychrobacter sp. PAMC 21119 TaxID=1112209 RepID=UPI00028959F3|nr:NADP transhydrogenase subunit alpha [Psychrobacter sp. PAMC 21119]
MTDHTLLSTDESLPKIAIIGGGLTGLLTATLLERAFIQSIAIKRTDIQSTDQSSIPQITIFEKSRSVGRLATRYRTDSQTGKNWQWAFGAQFFTAKTPSFQQFIAPWLETDLLQPWCAEVVALTPANGNTESSDIQHKDQWNTTQARYISTPKMTSWGRALADDLQHTNIKFKTRVAPFAQYPQNQTDDKTELFDESGNSLGCFDWVICTAPNGQALELMAESGFTESANITKPKMQACYTLMLGWGEVQSLPATLTSQTPSRWDVAYVNNSPLDRIFIEHQKPAHNDLLPSVTIHARNDWSEIHVDDDIDTITEQLLQAAQHALHWDDDTAPSQVDCHRWRYAATTVDNNEALGILVDPQHQWIVSGDWCGHGNIESCYQVAQQTVEAIWKTK